MPLGSSLTQEVGIGQSCPNLEDPGSPRSKPHAPTDCVSLLVTLCLCPLQTHLLSKLPILDSQVITINPELPVEEAAEDYAKKLGQVSPLELLQEDLTHPVGSPRVME